MEILTNKNENGITVSLLFDKDTVSQYSSYWHETDTVIGYEYEFYISELFNSVVAITKVMVEDNDGIRKHMTPASIEDYHIAGCNTNQEKYDWLLKAGHNMDLVGTIGSGINSDRRISVLKKHMLPEVKEAISSLARTKEEYDKAIRDFLY